MRNVPLPVALLVAIGATLFAGGAGGGVIRWLAQEKGTGTIGWAYVVSAGAVAAAAAVWVFVRWRRRRPPFTGETRALREALWVAACAVAGAGIGTYAGALNRVGEPHWATLLGYFLFLPVAYLAAILSTTALRAVVRVVVTTLTLEFNAQVSCALATKGHLAYWDDITGIYVAFLAGALVTIALVARWRVRLVAWMSRARTAAPSIGAVASDAEPPRPRRA